MHDYAGNEGGPPLTSGTFSDGWAIGAAAGRRINRAVRTELEFSFRSNTGDLWTVNGATAPWSGHIFGYSGMANLYHDFDCSWMNSARPYIGAGIGLMLVDGDFRTNMTKVEIEDEALAYQFMAGVSKNVQPGVDLFTEYRFFATTNVDVVNAGVIPSVLLDREEVEQENVLFGIRFTR